jgi:dihydrofolate reductase
MKLTTTTNVSVDGVMQGLGGPDEDRSGGFKRGGWALPLFDNEAATFVNQVYQRADAFLFGRRTYEIFAGYWGVMADSVNPIAAALNTRPKYLASTTLTEPRWADTTVLSGDVAAAIRELKAKPRQLNQRGWTPRTAAMAARTRSSGAARAARTVASLCHGSATSASSPASPSRTPRRQNGL